MIRENETTILTEAFSHEHIRIYYLFIYMYVRVFCLNVSTPPACNAHRSQRRVSDPLGLKLQIVIYHVGTGNWTQQVLLTNKPSLLPSTWGLNNYFWASHDSAHVYNPSTWEEKEGLSGSRSSCDVKWVWVWGQPGLHETLSLKM